MKRYFFHTQTSSRFTDEVGLEMESPLKARREAIRTCGEMMKDAPEGFWGSRPWHVTVTDDAGIVLWEILLDGSASEVAA